MSLAPSSLGPLARAFPSSSRPLDLTRPLTGLVSRRGLLLGGFLGGLLDGLHPEFLVHLDHDGIECLAERDGIAKLGHQCGLGEGRLQ